MSHQRALEDSQWQEYLCFLRASPAIAREKNSQGNLPFHILLEKQAPELLAEVVLEAFPEAARRKHSCGDLPLHQALRRQPVPKQQLARAIFKAYPAAAREPDHIGNLPLHLACRRHELGSFALELLDAFPAAACTKTQTGELPLHIACEHLLPRHIEGFDASIVLSSIFQAFPGAARQRPTFGHLPLHQALQSGVTGDLLLDLVRAGPKLRCVLSGPGLPADQLVALVEAALSVGSGAELAEANSLTLLARHALQSRRVPAGASGVLARLVRLGAVARGGFEAAVKALGRGSQAPKEGRKRRAGPPDRDVLGVLLRWHCGGARWFGFMQQSLARVLGSEAGMNVAGMLYGYCSCALCRRYCPIIPRQVSLCC